MCEHLDINGSHVIICGARRKRRFCSCGREADFECDWKVAIRKSGTCDAPICKLHAKEVGPGKHLCREHQVTFAVWKRKNGIADDADLRARLQGAPTPEQQTLFAESSS
jgi:hypothetical protein